MKSRPIFISYVKEDVALARRLRDELTAFGFQIWIDEDQLKVGKRWQAEIRSAVVAGGAFIACFSSQSEQRDRSYMREEVLAAISELRRRPRDQSWFLPVILDQCDLPDIQIGPAETLLDLHYISLEHDFKRGVQRIATALRPEHQLVVDLMEEAGQDFARGDYPGARAKLTSALSINPRDPEVLGKRGQVNAYLGDLEDSLRDYEEAGSHSWAELAYIYWCAGDRDSAIAALKRLSKYGRSSAQSEYDLGCILFESHRAKESCAAFERALELAPDSIVVHKALASILLRVSGGDFTRLFELTEDAHRRFGPDPDLLEARAHGIAYGSTILDSYRMPDDHENIRKNISNALREAVVLDPDNVRRLYRAAMLSFRVRDYEAARGFGAKGLLLMPDSTSFRIILAQVAEYGSSDKLEGIENSIRYYDEAAAFPLDHLDRDDGLMPLEGDTRVPRPATVRFTTIPLTIAGTSITHAQESLKRYSALRAEALEELGD